MNDIPKLQTIDLRRYYERGQHEVRALDGVTINVGAGELVAIVGSSGSGKTTLLNLLAGLDTPTSGSVLSDGVSLSDMSRRERALYRAHKVGMVFQSFNLISHYTALQNVETALYFNGTPRKEREERARTTLERLGLRDRISHKPADLSGGEQQRVAVARAIVKQPEILIADEPTGNLDYENARQIAELLISLHKEHMSVILVTHNLELAHQCAERTIKLQYGRVVGADTPGNTGAPQ